jgi:hypothetical protein
MRRLLTILMLLLPLGAWAGTCGDGYENVNIRTISRSMFTASLTNFPFQLAYNGVTSSSITFSGFKTIANGGSIHNLDNNSKGFSGPADYVLCDALNGGNKIKFEIHGYNAVSGAGAVVFQSNPVANSDVTVYEFYGNSSVTTTQQDLSLWSDANYQLVCHFPDGSSLSVVCSQSAASPTNSGATAGAGIVDGGAVFSSAHINSGATYAQSGAFSVETWINKSSCGTGNFQQIAGNYNGSNGWFLYVCNAFGYRSVFLSPAGQLGASTSLTFNQFEYVVGTYSSGNSKLYLDGSVDTTMSGGTTATGGTTMWIGDWPVGIGGVPLAGSLDEFRIATVDLGADWISTTKRNISSLAPNVGTVTLDKRTPAGLTSGAYCIPVVIDHTKVPNTDQTNYQLTVGGWYYTWMRDVVNGAFVNTAAGINNIVWYSDSVCTTVIPFETEAWSNTTGLFQGWAQVASASHTVDTTVYLGIGNPSNTTDQSNKTSLWGTQGVIDTYHFGSSTSLNTVGSGSAALDLSVGLSGTPQASLDRWVAGQCQY